MPASIALPPRPQVHGHRGCRGLRPENTLPGFLYALELGVDVLEMDVVISADNQVVVSHEPWLSPSICLGPDGHPVAPGRESQHNLYRLPYATIRQCDCGTLQHLEFPEQLNEPAPKPLLREVLRAVEAAASKLGRSPVGYSIEVKADPTGDGIFHPTPEPFLTLVLAELQAADVLDRTTLLSFDSRVLQLSHRFISSLPTCLLLEAHQPWLPGIRQLGFEPDVLGPDFTTVSARAVEELKAAHPNLRLVPWTVNEPADMEKLWRLGVDAITTDYPNRLLAVLA